MMRIYYTIDPVKWGRVSIYLVFMSPVSSVFNIEVTWFWYLVWKLALWPIRNVHPGRLCITNLLLNLHKTLNFDEHEPSFEIINVLDQLICTRRQIKFQIFRNSNCKIGFNTTANKFFYFELKLKPSSGWSYVKIL